MWVGTEKRAQQGVEQKSQSLRVAEGTETEVTHSVRRGAISLRSMQLRHHLGPLNTIPFGEIKNVKNFSRDWVIMKLPLRLTFDTRAVQR